MAEKIIELQKKNQFSKKPTTEILFYDMINTESVGKLTELIEKTHIRTPDAEIVLRVNSSGGQVYEVFHLIDYFRNISNPVTTIAETRCASAAALLVAAGDKRYAWENCQFIIHQIQISKEYKCSLPDLVTDVKKLMRLNRRFLRMMAEFTGQDVNKIICDTRTDKEMNSKEALSYGLIDAIIPPKKKLILKSF